MSNALTMFDAKGKVPAHIAGFLEQESNITERATVPSLTIEGKVWAIAMDGEKRKVSKRDEDGDEVPVQVLRVVILDYAKRRGRQYYEGTYDPSAVKQPDCWSEDGVLPHKSVTEPKHDKCEGCPMSIKGSKTQNGKASTACSQFRMVALVPANNLAHTPLRLKLAITSDWDKLSPDWEAQHNYAFNNYTDFLRTKGVTHTATLVTKMRFDPNVAYPKILFSPDKWLSDEQLAVIAPVAKSDAVKKLISGSFTPAGGDGVATDAAEAAKPVATPPKGEMFIKPLADEDEDGDAPAPVAAKPKKQAAPVTLEGDDEDVQATVIATPKKAKPAPAVLEDEDEDGEVMVKPVAAKPQATKKSAAKAPAAEPVAATNVPESVANILSDWGDDD